MTLPYIEQGLKRYDTLKSGEYSEWTIKEYTVPQITPLLRKLSVSAIAEISRQAQADKTIENDYLDFFIERGWRSKLITGTVVNTTTGQTLPSTGFERYLFGVRTPAEIVTTLADNGTEIRETIVKEHSITAYEAFLHTIQGTTTGADVSFTCWSTGDELLQGLLARLNAEGRGGKSEDFHRMTKILNRNHPSIDYAIDCKTSELRQSLPILTSIILEKTPQITTTVTLSDKQKAGYDVIASFGVLGLPWWRAWKKYMDNKVAILDK